MHPEELNNYYLLALCIWRESRGEPVEGKILVAQTIKNRVDDGRWPDTYSAVITQPLQFSAFNKNDIQVNYYPKPDDKEWADCVAVADLIMDLREQVSKCNHYHNKTVKPNWADPTKVTNRVGNHIFYSL